MGYDLGECLICYCAGGGNNPTDDPQRNICPDCFKKSGATCLRGRAYSYVTIHEKVICSFCETQTVCVYQADICSGCASSLNPKGHELQTKEIDENDPTICQDNRCQCPHCPRNQEPDPRDLFSE
jgi:hypothetical protein